MQTVKRWAVKNFHFETWKFSTIRSKALLRPDSNVSRSPFAWTFNERFRPFVTFVWPEKIRNVGRSGTHRNGQGRWGSGRNVERSGTEMFILLKINVLKRLQNHAYGTFPSTFQKERNTVMYQLIIEVLSKGLKKQKLIKI